MSQTACIYNFGEAVHDNDWNFKISGSLFWRVYHVLEGNASVRIHGMINDLRPGYFYMIPAFAAHEDILRGSFRHQYLHFRLDDPLLSGLLDEYELIFEIPETKVLTDTFHRISELCAGFELESALPQEYERKTSYIYWTKRYESLGISERLELGGCIRVVLAEFIRKSKMRRRVRNPRVAQGRLFMDRHFCDPVIIEDVVTHVGMRPESFTRAFRKEYNRTPYAYLLEKRLNKAKNLLLLTAMSVKEVAMACGFRDVSYFCMVFKKNTSASPGEFRRGGGLV